MSSKPRQSSKIKVSKQYLYIIGLIGGYDRVELFMGTLMKRLMPLEDVDMEEIGDQWMTCWEFQQRRWQEKVTVSHSSNEQSALGFLLLHMRWCLRSPTAWRYGTYTHCHCSKTLLTFAYNITSVLFIRPFHLHIYISTV